MERKTLTEERFSTDILIVGAGAGGLMAAISAVEAGADVILCEKGNARRSGGIPAGNDHYLCFIPGAQSEVFKENYIRSNLSSGFANEEMVRALVDRSFEVLQKWESWGATMKMDGHYEFTGHAWPGSKGEYAEPGTDRTRLHFSDPNLCPKLEKQARDRGVRVINRVMITEILKDSTGRVVGAVGLSTREPKLLIFQAKNIILNKCMFAKLAPHSDVIYYNTANPGTNDQAIMAYRAGADVTTGGYAGRQVAVRFGPTSGRGTWIGVLRDNDGNPIAPPYLEKLEAELGDPAVENPEALDRVWQTGKGPVWMDPRGITEEEEQYLRRGLESESGLPFLRWVDEEKIDIKKTRFEFSTHHHHGGINIREMPNFMTTVEGLHAIPRGGLSGSGVGGMVTGEAAARDVRNVEFSDLEEHSQSIRELKESYEEILNRGGGPGCADWYEVQWAIWQTMHCYALPEIRTEATLMTGYKQLLRLREKAKQIIAAGNPHDLYHCVEMLNTLDIAEIVLLAVNEIKESRGASSRLDYPFINPMYNNKRLIITQKDGKPFLWWEEAKKRS